MLDTLFRLPFRRVFSPT